VELPAESLSGLTARTRSSPLRRQRSARRTSPGPRRWSRS